MEGVKTSRFPQIDDRFHIGGVTAERESPERSWARIRTYLIDNPKDDDLIRRQEIWNYQTKNRGVIKSMLKTVPNVPYRVKKRKMEKFSERNKIEDNSLVLPQIPKIDGSPRLKLRGVFSPPPKPRPLGYTKDFETKRKEIQEQLSKFESAARFLGKPTSTDDFSNAKQYDYAKSTLKSVSEKFPKIPDQKRRRSESKFVNPPLSQKKKNVSFSLNDLRTEDFQMESRCSSASSISSACSDGVLGNCDVNYGPSSHNYVDNPKFSVYDMLNRNVGDVRTMGVIDRNNMENIDMKKEVKKKHNDDQKPLSEKQWFEKVLADKEIFDMSEYDNYARRKPRNENVRNNNLNSQIPPKSQTTQNGRQNVPEIQNKTNVSTNRPNMDIQVRGGQNISSMRNVQENSIKTMQNNSNSRPVTDVKGQGRVTQDVKPLQDKTSSKVNVSGPRPSIYSQNQSKSVYPQVHTKQKKNNVHSPSETEPEIATKISDSRNSYETFSIDIDSSPNSMSSRLSDKIVDTSGRHISEKNMNASFRLLFSKESSPTDRLSVERHSSSSVSPIQKPNIKTPQNSSYNNSMDNVKYSPQPQGNNQKLPFDVPRQMPRVPMKTSGYFPIFPSDGRPVRKIGKPKNNVQKLQSPPIHEFFDSQDDLKSGEIHNISTMSEHNQLNAPLFI